ncbi:putative aminotransferase [Anopheles sinensis]|uniref:Putative aminotransferase n=1 Tax=Anopheles sinensis TaxID=74873 RepID=A0A084VTJ8_ANOSI|nr:putative aminotransferase [Anopheles sinensis]
MAPTLTGDTEGNHSTTRNGWNHFEKYDRKNNLPNATPVRNRLTDGFRPLLDANAWPEDNTSDRTFVFIA